MTKSWANAPGDRDEGHLDAMLAGEPLPADVDADLQRVSAALSALAAPPSLDELQGQHEALVAFRDAFATSRTLRRTRTGRRSALTSLLSLKAAAVVATAGGLTFGGAAFAGVLPDAAQDFAHHTIGAPAAPKPTKGPDPSGPAAFGLCTAWSHNHANGHSSEHSQAFRNLAAAAGGTEHIAAYCGGVPHPSSDESDHADHPSEPPEKPEKTPSGKPSHDRGKSSQHESGHGTSDRRSSGRDHRASSTPSGEASAHSQTKPSSPPSARASTRPTARSSLMPSPQASAPASPAPRGRPSMTIHRPGHPRNHPRR